MAKTLLLSVDIRKIPEMNSHIYSPLINEKDNAAVQWERMIFSINGAVLIGYSHRKNEMLTLLLYV